MRRESGIVRAGREACRVDRVVHRSAATRHLRALAPSWLFFAAHPHLRLTDPPRLGTLPRSTS
ncbi:MAG: hypothetical protein EDS66_11675 [Planctomycetota bacterium]|nr:MAG: hypothetical protein EDS66_11675 [Planctomycetota bacterium]